MRSVTPGRLLFELDPVCEEFERAIRLDRTPRIEDFLRSVQGPARTVLFRELLALELHYRRERGPAPDLQEYRRRFPEYAPEIAELERASSGGGSRSAEGLAPGTRFGSYRIEREVGRGGMGIVYAARHEALDRLVALKVLPFAGRAGRCAHERFEREARAVARLHHESIVPVFEFGEVEGAPYFSMQLIEGVSLAERIRRWREARATRDAVRVRAVVRQVLFVARALHYAHERGVLHRDVKPSNVLIDADERPWLVDFGLARLDESDLTTPRDLLGTVRYLAPEALSGQRDVRGDVYSLGLSLYEALALEPAYPEADPGALMRAILTRDVPPLRRALPPASRDLETIVAKALARDPERRYESAGALALDLERHLDGLPVSARRPALPERLWRWTRRNRAAAIALAALALLALSATVAAAVFQRQKSRIGRLSTRVSGLLVESESARASLNAALYRSDMQRAAQYAFGNSGAAQVTGILAAWRPAPGGADPRGWEWSFLRGMVGGEAVVLADPEQGGSSLDWHPAGERVAIGGRSGLSIWDASARELVTRIRGSSHLRSLAFSPDGERIAHADMHTASVHATRTGELLARHPAGEHAFVSWHPDGSRLALSGRALTVWEPMGSGEVETVSSACLGRRAAFSPGGGRLAFAPDPERILVVETGTWRVLQELEAERLVGDVDFSPDGGELVAADRSNALLVFDTRSGSLRLRIERAHDLPIEVARWSPDGALLVSASADSKVALWDARTGERLRTFLGTEGTALSADFNPAGGRIASTTAPGDLRLWDLDVPPAYQHLAPAVETGGWPLALSWRPDGERLAVTTRRGVETWDLSAPLARREGSAPLRYLSWSPDGHLRLEVEDERLRLRDVATGRDVLEEGGLAPPPLPEAWRYPSHLRWSAGGRRLFASDGEALWIVDGLPSRPRLRRFTSEVAFERFDPSADGETLAVQARDTVRLLDVESGACVGAIPRDRLGARGSWVPDLGPTDARLAVGEATRLLLFDALSLEVRAVHEEHAADIAWTAWSPDGTRLATAARDGAVRVFDPEAGLLVALPGRDRVEFVAWSPDGRRLAALDRLGQLSLFDARAGVLAEQRTDQAPGRR